MWYLRISRIFGVFPLSRSADGAPKFSFFSLPAVYSLAICLCYTLSMANSIYSLIKEKEQLSYVLTVLSSTVVSVLTGYLISISSMCYSDDLVKMLAITQQSKFQYREQWRMDYLGVVPILYIICVLVNFILYGFLFPDSSATDTFLSAGSDWDWLLAFRTSFFDLCSEGMLLSAPCFLIIFGERMEACLEHLCQEISECCKTTMVRKYPAILCIGLENEDPNFVVQNPVCGTETLEMLLQVKDAFEIYLKIGGAFTFALVAETETWLFYLVCAVLINTQNSASSLAFIMRICQATTVILALVTVAELGQVTFQVTLEQVPSHQISNQVIIVGGAAAGNLCRGPRADTAQGGSASAASAIFL